VSAQILSGQPVVEKFCAELAPRIEQFRKAHGIAPTLAAVRVGNSPTAIRYAHSIDRKFTQCGMGFQMEALAEDATTDDLVARLNELDRNDNVHGILLQRPLPPSIDVHAALMILPTAKDIEGVSPINLGKLALNLGEYFSTSTPSATIELLKHYNIPLAGKRVVIVGRSDILGKPLALLLLHENATVIVCHSHTQNLAELTRQADVLIVGVGKPRLITASMVNRNAVVIDLGVNVQNDQYIGDVDFDAVKEIAAAISPVPGGTGPITTIMLMRNTIRAAELQVRQMGTRGRLKWLPTLKSHKPQK
jgi:methylenetetrahydrofolate dehydrogenase (NADP+)/methenyltetrahydrofolate cyclohydrolase